MKTIQFELSPDDNSLLMRLCGRMNEHLHLIEQQFNVDISNRGNIFNVMGSQDDINTTHAFMEEIYSEIQQSKEFTVSDLGMALQSFRNKQETQNTDHDSDQAVKTKNEFIIPRGKHQASYIDNIHKYPINFGIGPAGTGKTFLAIACAAAALDNHQIQRIVLVRPAVEAGENLGFLPGDLAQKVDPYMRPMYDALYKFMGTEKVHKLIEKKVIEVAPLAYMRGRTLNDAFIILDESQNTTHTQMKMFLTRIGFNSKAVVTGDITQIDLPNKTQSGLAHAIKILKNTNGVNFNHFDAGDVVRHPVVQDIIEAYEEHDDKPKDNS